MVLISILESSLRCELLHFSFVGGPVCRLEGVPSYGSWACAYETRARLSNRAGVRIVETSVMVVCMVQ